MLWLKRIALVFFALLCVLAALIAYFLFFFDPNRLKPLLEDEVAKYGAHLHMEGDLRWQVFPKLGLQVNDTQVYNNAEQRGPALLDLGHVSFALALKPLLSQEVQVDAIRLHEVTLNYQTLEGGSSNWDSLLASDAAETDSETEAATPEQASAQAFTLNIADIDVQALTLRYEDLTTGQRLLATLETLQVARVNLDGQPMPMHFTLSAELSELPKLRAGGEATVRYDASARTLNIDPLTLILSAKDAQAKAQAALSMALSTAELNTTLKLTSMEARNWLTTLSPDLDNALAPGALESVQMELDAQRLDDGTMNITHLFQVDDTQVKGATELVPRAESLPAVRSTLHGDTLNLNRYLKPNNEVPVSNPGPTAATSTPLPLELLRELDIDLEMKLDQLQYDALSVTQIQSKVLAHEGLLEVSKLNAWVAEGNLSANAALDARTARPTLKAEGALTHLNAATVAVALADFSQLEGYVSGQFSAQAAGADTADLVNTLSAEARVESDALRFSPFNLLKMYCQAAAIVEQKTLPEQNWAKFTQISPVTLIAKYANKTARLESFSGAIETLTTQAQGEFNTESGEFDFPIALSLKRLEQELPGCKFVDERWANQSVPLRCKGQLDNVGVDTCSLDTAYLKKIAEQRLEKEKQKHVDRVEKELEDEATKALEKHLESEDIDALKNWLKGATKK